MVKNYGHEMTETNTVQKAFLLGNPRSGTSLLRLIMNSHSKIVAPPECGFLHWWYQKYRDWNLGSLSTSLDNYLADLLTSKKIETWNIDRNRLREYLYREKPSDYAALSAAVYLYYAQQDSFEKPCLIVDKNNYYIHHIDEIIKAWPDATIVHLVRDGRDVACSYRETMGIDTPSPYKPNLSVDLSQIAREWRDNNETIATKAKELGVKYILIRYEDIVERPANTLTVLLSSWSLEYEPAVLDYHSKQAEPDATIDWKRLTKKPLDNARIGRYKNDLSVNARQQFESIADDTLRAYGYIL